MKLKYLPHVILIGLLSNNVFAYKILSEKSWTTGNVIEAHVEHHTFIKKDNSKIAQADTAIGGENGGVIRGKVNQNIVARAVHDVIITNTTDRPQLYEKKYTACILDGCAYNLINIALDVKESYYDQTFQYVTNNFSQSGRYGAYSAAEVNGESKAYKKFHTMATIDK